MERLIRNGMMYGSLKRIDEPHLIERYNRALEAMRLPQTKLDCFHIDLCGFSLEVADEIGDLNYMDPRGVNRRFIILAPEQRDLPLVRTAFTADSEILRRFFDSNMKAIETITLRDALYGEIENLVFSVDKPEDILQIRTVEFEVFSTKGLLREAMNLEKLIERFKTEPESWRDKELHAEIVMGAKRCGDVRKNMTIPQERSFELPTAFHTTHFGGTYVFRRPDRAVIFGDLTKLTPVPAGASLMPMTDYAGVLRFLREEGLVESLNGEWLKSSRIVEQRFRALVAEIVTTADPEFQPVSVMQDSYLNRQILDRLAILQADARFRAMSEARLLLANGGDVERFVRSLEPELQLIFRRALPEHPDAQLINRFLSEFATWDPMTLFVVNKTKFYDVYRGLEDRLKEFAVESVRAGYMPEYAKGDSLKFKKAVRERLFGLR